jgi:predicted GNAT superfamily acetyltransferase
MGLLIIKALDSIQEIKEIANVEAKIWGMRSEDTVPDHVLTAIARDGGVLLGAYQDEILIGFTLGWLGTIDPQKGVPASGQLKLVSHMTGVLPDYRDQRVGFKLKRAQREWALKQGLDLITWTYDPLESRNGYFNIHLLGCVCDTYLQNYYGEMSDEMNEGVQSDRFRVDWWIKNQWVEHLINDKREQTRSSGTNTDLAQQGMLLPGDPVKSPAGFLVPPEPIEHIRDARILVEIPVDYQEIRRADQDLAIAWRLYSRQIFEGYFNRKYKVVDFIYQKPPDPRSFYVLEQTYEDR